MLCRSVSKTFRRNGLVEIRARLTISFRYSLAACSKAGTLAVIYYTGIGNRQLNNIQIWLKNWQKLIISC